MGTRSCAIDPPPSVASSDTIESAARVLRSIVDHLTIERSSKESSVATLVCINPLFVQNIARGFPSWSRAITLTPIQFYTLSIKASQFNLILPRGGLVHSTISSRQGITSCIGSLWLAWHHTSICSFARCTTVTRPIISPPNTKEFLLSQINLAIVTNNYISSSSTLDHQLSNYIEKISLITCIFTNFRGAFCPNIFGRKAWPKNMIYRWWVSNSVYLNPLIYVC